MDPDGNRVPSAGDTLRATVRDCYSPGLEDRANGELELVLGVPVGAGPDAYAATMTFVGAGLTVGELQSASTTEASGSFRVNLVPGALSTELRISASSADDFALRTIDGANRTTERVRTPSLTKRIDFATTRMTNAIAFVLESELLKGRIEADTPAPLTGSPGSYPDFGGGTLRVRGEPTARAEASPSSLSANRTGDSATLQTISSASGAVTSTRTVLWSDLVEGFLWWDEARGVISAGNGYGTAGRPPESGFTVLYRAPESPFTVGSEIVLQFNQPLSTAETFAFQVVPATGIQPSNSAIETSTRVVGSRIIIKPARQLEHGTPYVLRKLSGRYISQGGSPELNWFFDGLLTQNNLVASATLGRIFAARGTTLQLDASGSVTSDGAIRSFSWRQLQGTPATLSGTTTARASALLNGSPAAVETLRFELTLENEFGETDRSLVDLEQVNDAASATLFHLRGTPGPQTLGNGALMLTQANGQFTLSHPLQGVRLSHADQAGSTSSFDAIAANDQPLTVGAYEGAVEFRSFGQIAPLLRASARNGSCGATAARFDVFEVAYGPAGDLTRLALDFEQRCRADVATSSLLGSVRINSTRPIRE